MIVSEERERERLLTRLRKHFASRRSPRTMLSLILIATGGAGFIMPTPRWCLRFRG